MIYLDKLSQWLADPHRKYDEGIALFDKLATDGQKETYGAYLHQKEGNVSAFDPHFTQLVNELVRVERGVRTEPSLYPAASEECMEEVRNVAKELKEAKERIISEHEEALGKLRDEMVVLMEDANDENNARSMVVAEKIEEFENAIAKLQQEVEELSKPGVKVVTAEMMPKGIRAKYDRIKEIVPLYATLHLELSGNGLTDEQRKEKAEALCSLDDERRRLWRDIDNWSEGKGMLEVDAERPKYSENSVVRGYEYARALKRLKENIKNSQKSADKALADGKQNVYDNAMKRIAGYQEELARIEAALKEDEEGQEEESAE